MQLKKEQTKNHEHLVTLCRNIPHVPLAQIIQAPLPERRRTCIPSRLGLTPHDSALETQHEGSGIETALCFSALALVQGQQKATACRILGSITWASTIGRTSSCPYFLFFFFGIVRVQFFPSKLPNTENLSLSLSLSLSLFGKKQRRTNKTKQTKQKKWEPSCVRSRARHATDPCFPATNKGSVEHNKDDSNTQVQQNVTRKKDAPTLGVLRTRKDVRADLQRAFFARSHVRRGGIRRCLLFSRGEEAGAPNTAQGLGSRPG